jgi:hypothetical protein
MRLMLAIAVGLAIGASIAVVVASCPSKERPDRPEGSPR